MITVLHDRSLAILVSQGEHRINDGLDSRPPKAVAALERRPRVMRIVDRGYDLPEGRLPLGVRFPHRRELHGYSTQ